MRRAHAVSSAAVFGVQRKILPPARRVFGRRGVERPLDADGPDVREERVARRWTGLDRRAHEVLVEIQQRREVRRQERGANQVCARRGLEPDAHRRPAAAAEERFRAGLTTATDRAGGTRTAAAIAAVGWLVATTALPVDQRQFLTVEQHRQPFARHRAKPGRRHVVAEDGRHRQRVLAVGREDVRHEHAAARAERHALDVVVLRCVFARAIDHQRRLFGITHREAADLLRCGDVRLDERGRQAERPGDVVKPRRRIVRGQVLPGIDLEVQQVADNVRVFGAVEAMQTRRWHEGWRRTVQRALERGDDRVEPVRIGPLDAQRRHLAGAGLADDQLPLLAVLVHVCRIERVHGQATRRIETGGLHLLAMAADAVLREKCALLLGGDRWRRSD